ncbi:hypothetical protein OESDEN_00064 [Oesophagostomum dentatum]|uniref:Uncharacterized protein n=1 Tax=Oesophagostomum dentatum TaxID=61180 RepID=A0A0B1TV32_OESDE|nr:hypothetical protein OESDEN_00064 [Oesophagostomum dentatum]
MWRVLALTLFAVNAQAQFEKGVPVVAGPPPAPVPQHAPPPSPPSPPLSAAAPSVPAPEAKSFPLPPYPPQPVYGVEVPPPPYGHPPLNPYDPQFPPPYQPQPYPPQPSPHDYYRSYDSSEEDDYGSCNSCYMVKSTCEDKPPGYDCRKPRVTYFYTTNGCQRAVLTCRGADDRWTRIVTKYDKPLTEGYAVAKMLKCKRGKWIAYDIRGQEEDFRTARCLIDRDHRAGRTGEMP